MSWDPDGYLARLKGAVERFEHAQAADLVGELIAAVADGAAVEPPLLREILQSLRRKRFFDLMERAAQALRLAGLDGCQIRRQHAQALIDQGKLMAALDLLEALVPRTADDPAEQAEARGLLGRVHKQIYVDAAGSGSGGGGGGGGGGRSEGEGARRTARQHLVRAIEAYRGVYVSDPTRHLWHGINTVALVCRAQRDGVALTAPPDAPAMAREILAAIGEPRPEAGVWNMATAAEACIALGRQKDALLWIGEYVQQEKADAFELASTLRQLVEVWQLSISTPPGSLLLPLLQSSLLDCKGGRVDLAPGALDETLASSRKVEGAAEDMAGQQLEKVLGREGVVSLRWYQTGLDRCRAVGQVQDRFGNGIGTGFLVRGGDFAAALAGRLLLLTNAHVVSDDLGVQAKHGSLAPEDAQIAFEYLPEAAGKAFRARLLWTSPPADLDATLLLLEPPVSAVDCYPMAQRVPIADGQQKVYIIGHPGGRSLSLSIHDNLLLDHDGKRLIHYRTPTEGGSSGSPVFNQQWDLIGLHHAGSLEMERLRGQEGRYAANEGIWIRRIVEQAGAAGLTAT
jgi:hypothetical protein